MEHANNCAQAPEAKPLPGGRPTGVTQTLVMLMVTRIVRANLLGKRLAR